MSRTLRSSTACVLVVLLAVTAGAAVLPSRALSIEMVRLPRDGAPAITETIAGVSSLVKSFSRRKVILDISIGHKC